LTPDSHDTGSGGASPAEPTGSAGASHSKGGTRANDDEDDSGHGGMPSGDADDDSSGAGGAPPKPDDDEDPIPPASGEIGWGHDSVAERRLARCATGAVTTTAVRSTALSVKVGTEARQTLERFAKRRQIGLGIDGLLGVSASKQSVTDVIDVERDVIATVSFEYVAERTELAADGQLRLLVDPPNFVARCGDAVFASELYGSDLSFVLLVRTSSRETREQVERDLKASLTISAITLDAGRSTSSEVGAIVQGRDVTASLLQLGGSSASTTALAGSIASSVRLGSCSGDTDCAAVLSDFLGAVTSPEVIEDLTSHTVVVEYGLVPWSTVGVTGVPDGRVESLASWLALAELIREMSRCEAQSARLLERGVLEGPELDSADALAEACTLNRSLLTSLYRECYELEPSEQAACVADPEQRVTANGYRQVDRAQLDALLELDRQASAAQGMSLLFFGQSIGPEGAYGSTGFQVARLGSWTAPFSFALNSDDGYLRWQYGVSDRAGALAGEPLLLVHLLGNADDCLGTGQKLVPTVSEETDLLLSSPIFPNMMSQSCELGFSVLREGWNLDLLAVGPACSPTGTQTANVSNPIRSRLSPSSSVSSLSMRLRFDYADAADRLGLR
jgi:hypothetical protein